MCFDRMGLFGLLDLDPQCEFMFAQDIQLSKGSATLTTTVSDLKFNTRDLCASGSPKSIQQDKVNQARVDPPEEIQ